jgi:hypothetical protein
MKLIAELISEEVEYVTESSESGVKKHYIHGPMLVADEVNKNGRCYTKDILEPEVDRYVREVVKEGRGYGELGHPPNPSINLERVSHIITELKWDGSRVIGKARLTETPMGKIAIGLMESGAKLGASSRGTGSLSEGKNGVMMVGKDYRIATAADLVADPSAPGAFVRGIMEGIDWKFDPNTNSWHEERIDNIRKSVGKMSMSQIEESKLSIFEDFINNLAVKL